MKISMKIYIITKKLKNHRK